MLQVLVVTQYIKCKCSLKSRVLGSDPSWQAGLWGWDCPPLGFWAWLGALASNILPLQVPNSPPVGLAPKTIPVVRGSSDPNRPHPTSCSRRSSERGDPFLWFPGATDPRPLSLAESGNVTPQPLCGGVQPPSPECTRQA
jgi:hypothetical protein